MKTFKTNLNGDINLYDFIIIASESFLDVGFYCGRGPTGTFQYYSLWTLRHVYKTRNEDTGLPIHRPVKSYVNTPTQYRIAKYSPELLEGDHKENYFIALEVFKLLNIEL